jgi:hypothetical protein
MQLQNHDLATPNPKSSRLIELELHLHLIGHVVEFLAVLALFILWQKP